MKPHSTREIITTGDGSQTIRLPDWNESYHSVHGAVQEAQHVFINNGFLQFDQPEIRLLEIGFGTGLNTLITLLEAQKKNRTVHYTGVEAYPVTEAEIRQLNYAKTLDTSPDLFQKLHQTPWEEPADITSFFKLTKCRQTAETLSDSRAFDLIYFDAFGPRVQPELWTETVFEKMHQALIPGGILVTYSAKGSVRRAMQTVGFEVERLPGPPGKREMLRGSRFQSDKKEYR